MQRLEETVTKPNGDIVVGASVEIRLAGTTTLATIYSTNFLTPQANPITTGQYGEFGYYAPDGRYDWYITGPGIVPRIVPDVLHEDPVDNAPNLGQAFFITDSTFTFTAAHLNGIVYFSNACALSVPVGLADGFAVVGIQYGAGTLNISPTQGSGAVVRNKDGLYSTTQQYQGIFIAKGQGDDFIVIGTSAA